MVLQSHWQRAFIDYLSGCGIPCEVPANKQEVYLHFRGNYLADMKVKVSFWNEDKGLLFLEFQYDWAFDDAIRRDFRVPADKLAEGCYRCVCFNKDLPHTKFCLNVKRELTVGATYYFVEKVDVAYLYQLAGITCANADLVYPVLADRMGIGRPKTGGAD